MSQKIKRFYSGVETTFVQYGFQIMLDDRPIKSAGQQVLQLPNKKMAEQIAEEWRQQKEFIDFGNMPAMRFASAVADNIMPCPDEARAEILQYAHSDLLCYRVSEPDNLVERQASLWDPVLDQFKEELSIEFVTSGSIQYVEQGGESMKRFEALIIPLEGYQLGAVHSVTVMTGSAALSIALHNNWLTVEAAWEHAHLDEDFQAEQWGEDEEAILRRQRRQAEFYAATLVFDR
ncbi:MAG: ATPase [bacterium]|nr:ATPase [bacterium]